MEPEYVWMDQVRQCLDIIYVFLVSDDVVWDFEFIIWSESVVLVFAHVIVEIVIQQCHNQSTIFVICDSATVVALCS